jgi:hypothetical protein
MEAKKDRLTDRFQTETNPYLAHNYLNASPEPFNEQFHQATK